MRKYCKLLLVLSALLATATALTDSSEVEGDLAREQVTLDEGNDLSWNGYMVSYSSGESYGNQILTFTDPGGVLIEQLSGDQLYGAVSELKKVSESVYVRVDEIKYEDSEVKLSVWTDEKEFGGSEINITAPEYIVKQSGDEFSIPVSIENKGGLEEAYRLSASSVKGVSTDFRYQGYNITRAVVEPGKEKEVTADIELDNSISTGEKAINFSVSNRSFSSKKFRFQVTESTENEKELRMSLEESYVEESSGETVETEVRIENIGDNLVEEVEPSVSVPENWNYTVEPEETENISSEEFQDFEVDIGIPSTSTSGDYFVDVGLENTEDFESENIRVNVSDTSSGFGLIGIILAVTAIILVAGVYRIFGRR